MKAFVGRAGVPLADHLQPPRQAVDRMKKVAYPVVEWIFVAEGYASARRVFQWISREPIVGKVEIRRR